MPFFYILGPLKIRETLFRPFSLAVTRDLISLTHANANQAGPLLLRIVQSQEFQLYAVKNQMGPYGTDDVPSEVAVTAVLVEEMLMAKAGKKIEFELPTQGSKTKGSAKPLEGRIRIDEVLLPKGFVLTPGYNRISGNLVKVSAHQLVATGTEDFEVSTRTPSDPPAVSRSSLAESTHVEDASYYSDNDAGSSGEESVDLEEVAYRRGLAIAEEIRNIVEEVDVPVIHAGSHGYIVAKGCYFTVHVDGWDMSFCKWKM